MTSTGATALSHDQPSDDHDDHDEHGLAENPRWVLVPLVVGMVIGLILAIVFGLGSGVRALV